MSPAERERLYALLDREGHYPTPHSLYEEMLRVGTLRHLARREVLVEAGGFNRNGFIVVDGVLYASYMTDTIEKIDAFAMAGTFFMCHGTFHLNAPSPLRYAAATRATVLSVPFDFIREKIDADPLFTRWMLGVQENYQFNMQEKTVFMAGNAKECYRRILNNWRLPLTRLLSGRLLASYMGITEQHLARIKRELAEEMGEKAKITEKIH